MFCLLEELTQMAKQKRWHEGSSPIGKGTSYGTGVKQKEGKVVSSFMFGKSKNSQNKPPKNLA